MLLQPPFAADPFARGPPSSNYPPPLIDNHKHRQPPLMDRFVLHFSIVTASYVSVGLFLFQQFACLGGL